MIQRIFRIATIIAASALLAVAYNFFILPQNLQSGGVTGVAMIIGQLSKGLNTGIIIFVINIPIFVLGFCKLGKRFVAKSFLSVVVTSLAMQWVPEMKLTDDVLLSSVFGGVIIGISIGLVLRAGGSTGGFDIIGVVLTLKREFPLGELMFFLNAIVVLVSGSVFGWEVALYTLVTIFVSGKVVDTLHTRHIKLTLMIITTRGEELRQRLIDELFRGVTVIDVEGAYSRKKRKMLIMVISRIELEDVKQLIQEADPTAFVNIMQTREVMGLFYKQSPFKHADHSESSELNPADLLKKIKPDSGAPLPPTNPAP